MFDGISRPRRQRCSPIVAPSSPCHIIHFSSHDGIVSSHVANRTSRSRLSYEVVVDGLCTCVPSDHIPAAPSPTNSRLQSRSIGIERGHSRSVRTRHPESAAIKVDQDVHKQVVVLTAVCTKHDELLVDRCVANGRPACRVHWRCELHHDESLPPLRKSPCTRRD